MDIRGSAGTVNIKPFDAKAASIIFVAYLFAQYVVSILIIFILSSYSKLKGIDESKILDSFLPLSMVIGFLITLVVIFELLKPYFSGSIKSGAYISLGLVKSSTKWCLLAASFGASISLFYMLILDSTFPASDDYIDGPIISALQLGGWIKFSIAFVAIFLGPINEELLFRGVLYSGLSKTFGKIASGILVTLIFIFMHVNEYSGYWVPLTAISVISIGALIIREFKGSLIPAIFFHSAYNLVQISGSYLL